MKKNVYFVSGIDTNIGKSYATLTWPRPGTNGVSAPLRRN